MDQPKVSASSLPVMSANNEELTRRGTPDSRSLYVPPLNTPVTHLSQPLGVPNRKRNQALWRTISTRKTLTFITLQRGEVAQQNMAQRKDACTDLKEEWHPRPKSPALKWHDEYTPTSLKRGRILVVDYVRQGEFLFVNFGYFSNPGIHRSYYQRVSESDGRRNL